MNKLNIYKLVCVLGFALLAACSQGSKVSGALSNSSTNGSSSVPGTLASCSFNGQEIPDSGTVTAYLASSVAYGSTCTSQVRSCSNGTLSGSYGFSACTVASALSCTFNNQTVASGGTVTGYTSSSVAAGQTCTTEVVSCLNGVLTPNNAFATCTVSTSPSPTPTPASCSFNGTTVASGSSVTAYLASSVAYGSTCTSQSRSCSNGTLSGTYTFSSCSVAAAASCTFNGKTVASGGTATGYTASSVPYGSTCTTEVVTCTNGTLSPSNAFATCTVAAAPTPTPTPTPTPVNSSAGCSGSSVVMAYNNGDQYGWGDFDTGVTTTDYTFQDATSPSGNEVVQLTPEVPSGYWLYHAPCYSSSCEATSTTPQWGVNITGCNFMYISLKAGSTPNNWQIYAILDFPSDTATGVPHITISNLSQSSLGNGWVQYKVPLYPTINGTTYPYYFYTGLSQTALSNGTNTFYKFGLQDESGLTGDTWEATDVYFSAQ